MNQQADSQLPNEQELSLETLDQWESELEEFAADIKRRFAMASLLIDASDSVSTDTSGGPDSPDQVLELLKSVRSINQ